MHIIVLIYVAALMIMDIICIYHLVQYRGMKRYATGIRFAALLFVLATWFCIVPLTHYL